MPRMGGAETIAALRRIRPGLKVIAISGAERVSGVDAVAAAIRLGADRMLFKPFDQDEFLATVSEVLSGAEADPAYS